MCMGNFIIRPLLFLGLATACSAAGTETGKAPAVSPKTSSPGSVKIPTRPDAALFQGEQGMQNTEVSCDPTTHMVTFKMLVQDPNGYFVPNIRRDNFAIYE